MENGRAKADAAPCQAMLQEYENSLVALQPSCVSSDPSCLLRTLLARDAVADCIGARHDLATSQRLLILDEKFRGMAPEITDALAEGQSEMWRASFSPRADAWWWRLDEESTQSLIRQSPWWPVATGILLTISASLTADIARRFLSNGPDFYGALSTISQGAVTIIAGSTLTKTGRGWLDRWLSSFGIHTERRPQWYTALAFCVLILVSSLDLSLPLIALHYYDARGRELFQNGKLHSAIESFQRATSLAPSEYLPHFDLADAQEELLDIDRAIGEYGAAIQANPDYYPAYNNLARLYLIKRKDTESALRALRTGILRVDAERRSHPSDCSKPNSQCYALYALHKNLAWVNVENKWYDLARIDVTKAIQADHRLGGIYCLLAQIEVAEGKPDAATKSWGTCLWHAQGQLRGDEHKQEDIEETWIAMAEEWELKR